MKKMKNHPQITRGGKGTGRESPIDFMRVSMDKNEENEKSSSENTPKVCAKNIGTLCKILP